MGCGRCGAASGGFSDIHTQWIPVIPHRQIMHQNCSSFFFQSFFQIWSYGIGRWACEWAPIEADAVRHGWSSQDVCKAYSGMSGPLTPCGKFQPLLDLQRMSRASSQPLHCWGSMATCSCIVHPLRGVVAKLVSIDVMKESLTLSLHFIILDTQYTQMDFSASVRRPIIELQSTKETTSVMQSKMLHYRRSCTHIQGCKHHTALVMGRHVCTENFTVKSQYLSQLQLQPYIPFLPLPKAPTTSLSILSPSPQTYHRSW